jgi:hypothetical protein
VRGVCNDWRRWKAARVNEHSIQQVEKQRTNDRLLADQGHGGVSLRNPLECLAANRLADHILRNAELPDQVYILARFAAGFLVASRIRYVTGWPPLQ